jgi:glutathione S-transferase
MTTNYKIDFHCVTKPDNAASSSAFCQKLETVFRLGGIKNYELKWDYPHNGPKGKVPWIVLHTTDTTSKNAEPTSTPIGDSHLITQTLIAKGIIPDFDASLTPSQKADSRAWQAYTEELLYPALVWTRWLIPANHAQVRKVFDTIPFYIRWILEWLIYGRIKSGLWGHGVGRHSKDEIVGIVEKWVGDLRDHFVAVGSPFFHGDTPTYIDCVIYGVLCNALQSDANPEFTAAVLSSGIGKDKGGEVLRDYVKRCTRLWFPEYKQLLEIVD